MISSEENKYALLIKFDKNVTYHFFYLIYTEIGYIKFLNNN